MSSREVGAIFASNVMIERACMVATYFFRETKALRNSRFRSRNFPAKFVLVGTAAAFIVVDFGKNCNFFGEE